MLKWPTYLSDVESFSLLVPLSFLAVAPSQPPAFPLQVKATEPRPHQGTPGRWLPRFLSLPSCYMQAWTFPWVRHSPVPGSLASLLVGTQPQPPLVLPRGHSPNLHVMGSLPWPSGTPRFLWVQPNTPWPRLLPVGPGFGPMSAHSMASRLSHGQVLVLGVPLPGTRSPHQARGCRPCAAHPCLQPPQHGSVGVSPAPGSFGCSFCRRHRICSLTDRTSAMDRGALRAKGLASTAGTRGLCAPQFPLWWEVIFPPLGVGAAGQIEQWCGKAKQKQTDNN